MADEPGPIRLHHWVYGVTPGEGYGVKSTSKGLNLSLFEAPLRGAYTPIRGEAMQSPGGIDSRMVHPAAAGDDLLLSRLGAGPRDELGRPTFQNHVAIVPVKALFERRLTLASVDAALGASGAPEQEPTKELAPLRPDAPPPGWRPAGGLAQHMTRAAAETIATRRIKTPFARTLLLMRDSMPGARNEVLFKLVELLVLQCVLEPFPAMSDAPTASTMNRFTLVISARGLRSDDTWAIVEAPLVSSPLKRVDDAPQVYAAIDAAFDADASDFA
jgi:hypothetical protein